MNRYQDPILDKDCLWIFPTRRYCEADVSRWKHRFTDVVQGGDGIKGRYGREKVRENDLEAFGYSGLNAGFEAKARSVVFACPGRMSGRVSSRL